MKSTPDLPYLIKTHLQSGNLEYLEPVLELGYEKLPRTRHYVSLLKKGFLYTADHHLNSGDLFRSLSAFEYARNLTLYDPKLLKKEFKLLERIFDQFYPDFVNRDLQVYRGLLKVLQSKYLKRFPNVTKVLESLDRRASRLLDHAPEAVEGKYTYSLEKIFCNMYNDLTPEEQAELFAEIIAPEILREIGEKLEKDRVEEDSEDESS